MILSKKKKKKNTVSLAASFQALQSKADPRMRYGIVVGHRLKQGCHWSGEHLIHDLDVFLNRDLGVSADVNWGRIAPQVTKQSGMIRVHYVPP